MLVTGKTGAGKSFLVADLILQQRRRGAAVFVLDKGDSYRRLAELLDGQYLRLSAEPHHHQSLGRRGRRRAPGLPPPPARGDGRRRRGALGAHARGVRAPERSARGLCSRREPGPSRR